jgi:hypothetical protein
LFFYILVAIVVAAALIIGASDARELENASPKRRIKEFFASASLIGIIGFILSGLLFAAVSIFVIAGDGEKTVSETITYKVAPNSKIETSNTVISFYYLDAAGNIQQIRKSTDHIEFQGTTNSQVTIQEVDVRYPALAPWVPKSDTYVVIK